MVVTATYSFSVIQVAAVHITDSVDMYLCMCMCQ